MDRIPLDALLEGPRASKSLERICNRINAEEIFIYPTETIYGIGGRADKEDIRKKIIDAKKRKSDHPMVLLAGKKETLSQCNVDFPPAAQILSNKFWPGYLTLVLPIKNNKQTVAVRISSHPFLKAIFTRIHVPIFSTSANISGTDYKNDPVEICSTFSNRVDFMIDAGILPSSPPSTIVGVSPENTVTMVREGAISRVEIESVLRKIDASVVFGSLDIIEK
jgi:L-threonylcarbamoyladenylate synthase